MSKPAPVKIGYMEPMYAVGVRELPSGPDWLYEIKFDGYRCIAANDSSGVRLWSRRGNSLTRPVLRHRRRLQEAPPRYCR